VSILRNEKKTWIDDAKSHLSARIYDHISESDISWLANERGIRAGALRVACGAAVTSTMEELEREAVRGCAVARADLSCEVPNTDGWDEAEWRMGKSGA
jgi:hypothetical protein